MPALAALIEAAIGGLLKSARGRDAKLFTKCAAFNAIPSPTLDVTSPECGETNSSLLIAHTPLGENRFPEISWSRQPSTGDAGPDIVEYLVIVEDPDAPLPSPVVHAIYYGIPASKTTIVPADLRVSSDTKDAVLTGGFKYGMNRRQTVWGGARPVLGHGMHRYMFQVVGLSESIDTKGLGKVPSKELLEKAVEGKIAAWGVWVGTFERKFGSNGE